MRSQLRGHLKTRTRDHVRGHGVRQRRVPYIWRKQRCLLRCARMLVHVSFDLKFSRLSIDAAIISYLNGIKTLDCVYGKSRDTVAPRSSLMDPN